jgi:hypothetical protein
MKAEKFFRCCLLVDGPRHSAGFVRPSNWFGAEEVKQKRSRIPEPESVDIRE